MFPGNKINGIENKAWKIHRAPRDFYGTELGRGGDSPMRGLSEKNPVEEHKTSTQINTKKKSIQVTHKPENCCHLHFHLRKPLGHDRGSGVGPHGGAS